MTSPRPVTRTLHGPDAGQRSRPSDDRARSERPAMDQWSPATALETPPNSGGYRYRWIAEHVNGSQTSRNVQMALREGYVRVTIEQLNELPQTFIVDEDIGDGYARTGGLILMRLPEEFARQRQEHYMRRSQQSVASANEIQGVPQKETVYQDRGTRSLVGREAYAAVNNPSST